MTFPVAAEDLSPIEQLALTEDDWERDQILRRLSIEERAAMLSWLGMRRASQVAPTDDDWLVWLFMAGRGSGKSRAAAEDTIDRVEAIGKIEHARWAVICPTFGDFRDVAVEGESGLLSVLLRRKIEHEWNRSHGELRTARWTIQGYSAEKPDRLRGPQHHGAWLDEPASYRWPKALWDTLLPSLRLGQHPRIVVTGTPKVTWLMRYLVAESKANPLRYRLSTATTYRNAANLPAILLEQLTHAYGTTRLGRQELMGELLEEAEGALWTLDVLERNRVGQVERDGQIVLIELPELARKVVGVDPAPTSTPDSDETGIVACGVTSGLYPHGYVLGDWSGRWTPEQWGRKAIDLAIAVGARTIIAERNAGFDLVESNLKAARRPDDPPIQILTVHAKKSKELRAGPIATLYELDRIHHHGVFADLETQQCTWVPGGEAPGRDSPDRVDALVYALLELMDGPQVGGSLSQFTGTFRGR